MKNPIQSIAQVNKLFRTAPRLTAALARFGKVDAEEADNLWFVLREVGDAEFFCKVTDPEDQPTADILANPQKYIAVTGDIETAVVLFVEADEEALIKRLAKECKGCQDEAWAQLEL